MEDMFFFSERFEPKSNLKNLTKEELKNRLRYFKKVEDDHSKRWLWYKFRFKDIDFGIVEYSDERGRTLVRRMTWNWGVDNEIRPYHKGYKSPPKKYHCFNGKKIDDIIRAIQLGILIIDESSKGYCLQENTECFRTYRAARKALT